MNRGARWWALAMDTKRRRHRIAMPAPNDRPVGCRACRSVGVQVHPGPVADQRDHESRIRQQVHAPVERLAHGEPARLVVRAPRRAGIPHHGAPVRLILDHQIAILVEQYIPHLLGACHSSLLSLLEKPRCPRRQRRPRNLDSGCISMHKPCHGAADQPHGVDGGRSRRTHQATAAPTTSVSAPNSSPGASEPVASASSPAAIGPPACPTANAVASSPSAAGASRGPPSPVQGLLIAGGNPHNESPYTTAESVNQPRVSPSANIAMPVPWSVNITTSAALG